MIERKTLCYGGGFQERNTTIKAFIFAEMLRLADPIIVSYKSDLWHDAKWLDQELETNPSFIWTVRPTGTHIGDMGELWYKGHMSSEDRAYRLSLCQEDLEAWVLYIETLTT